MYDGGTEPDELLAGATTMPSDMGRLLPVVAHVLDSLTALRATLPGMRDPGLLAELEDR